MAIEFPSDLIDQIQISLRNEAGVPSYDPNDSTLTDLPTLQEAIEQLDPCPPYLRCKQCRGRLLRGLRSIVCVFCGAQQQREIPPDPIPFKSTLGYRWLLQSLDLDGSEIVDTSDSNKGQNASMILSDLLNLELKWPADSEKIGNNDANKAPTVIKKPLNVAGVDLDNFFSDTKKEGILSVSEQQLIPDKPIIETPTSSGQGSFSLFEHIQSTETLVRPNDGAVEDPSSGWEAEFQSAQVRSLPEETISIGLFPDASSSELIKPLETTFGSEAEIKFEIDDVDSTGKEKDVIESQASISGNWIQGNQWHTSNIESSSKTGREATKDGEPIFISNNLSSNEDNLFHGDLWVSSTEKRREDEDSFDAWQDFTSSANAPNNVPGSSNLTSTTKTSTHDLAPEENLVSSSNNFQEMDFGDFMEPDLFAGTSGLHNSSTIVNDVQDGAYSDRLVEMNAGDLKNTDNRAGTSDEVMLSGSADNTVEVLMSQMHDLSFMLDSNLSIPQKKDADSAT